MVGSGPGGMYTAEFFLKKFGGEVCYFCLKERRR